MSAPRVEPEVLELHPSCDDVTPWNFQFQDVNRKNN
jgi:hypothetical protein